MFLLRSKITSLLICTHNCIPIAWAEQQWKHEKCPYSRPLLTQEQAHSSDGKWKSNIFGSGEFVSYGLRQKLHQLIFRVDFSGEKKSKQITLEQCQCTGQLRKLKIIVSFQGSLKIRILTRAFSIIFMINNFFEKHTSQWNKPRCFSVLVIYLIWLLQLLTSFWKRHKDAVVV